MYSIYVFWIWIPTPSPRTAVAALLNGNPPPVEATAEDSFSCISAVSRMILELLELNTSRKAAKVFFLRSRLSLLMVRSYECRVECKSFHFARSPSHHILFCLTIYCSIYQSSQLIHLLSFFHLVQNGKKLMARSWSTHIKLAAHPQIGFNLLFLLKVSWLIPSYFLYPKSSSDVRMPLCFRSSNRRSHSAFWPDKSISVGPRSSFLSLLFLQPTGTPDLFTLFCHFISL